MKNILLIIALLSCSVFYGQDNSKTNYNTEVVYFDHEYITSEVDYTVYLRNGYIIVSRNDSEGNAKRLSTITGVGKVIILEAEYIDGVKHLGFSFKGYDELGNFYIVNIYSNTESALKGENAFIVFYTYTDNTNESIRFTKKLYNR